MCDLIVSVPDHCLSFHFTMLFSNESPKLKQSKTSNKKTL